MASAIELSQFDILTDELKTLRNKCELQGTNFKQIIANDPVLKQKADQFKILKVKVRQHRKQQKLRKTQPPIQSHNAFALDENEEPIRSSRGRKRRYTELINQQPLGDISSSKNVRCSPSRKRLKAHSSFRNHVGFSPCFTSMTARKAPKPKESVITNLEPISMDVDDENLNDSNDTNDLNDKENVIIPTNPTLSISTSTSNPRKKPIHSSNAFGTVSLKRLNISSPAMNTLCGRGTGSRMKPNKKFNSLQTKLYQKSTKQMDDDENHQNQLVDDEEHQNTPRDDTEMKSNDDQNDTNTVDDGNDDNNKVPKDSDLDIDEEEEPEPHLQSELESDPDSQSDSESASGSPSESEHEDEDYDGDSDEYVPPSHVVQTAKRSRRSRTVRTRKSCKTTRSSRTSKAATPRTKSTTKRKPKKANSVPQTVEIGTKRKKRTTTTRSRANISSTGKKIKKSVKMRVKTNTKTKASDTRKVKKDGDLVSKNFKKTDLRSKRYSRKGRGKERKFSKWDKFGNRRKDSSYYEYKERMKQKEIRENNVDLEDEEAMMKELNSDSDAEREMEQKLKEMERDEEEQQKKLDEMEMNRYSERLHQLQIGVETDKMKEHDSDLQSHPNDGDAIDELLHDVLKKEYGYDAFRNGQKEAIKLILQKKSVLLLLSTGAGKSLCYQIPTILRQNNNQNPVTLVISPLISLMKDQCENLPPRLKGVVWKSKMKTEEYLKHRRDLVNGKIHILFVSPEKLDANQFRAFLKNTIGPQRLQFACIDEAHCISEWSHNFRPSYLRLKQILRDYLQIPCILACTATATVITQLSIQKNIGIERENVVSALEPRENLHLTVGHIGGGVNKKEKLVQLLCSKRFRGLGSLIVYATTQREVDELAGKLNMRLKRDYGSVVAGYHAGKETDERTDIQQRFMNGKVTILVATIAFGMGLNKRDVRGVVHYSMPKSMEYYVQEVGRAGRDGLGSECHVFYDHSDLARHRSWVHKNGLDLTQIKRILYDVFSAKNVKIAKNAWIRNLDKKRKTVRIKSAIQRRKRKKDQDQDFSDEDDMDSDDEGFRLTEFKAAGDVVTVHKSTEIERRYDAPQVVLGTIFTFLDVYKGQYIQQLPMHRDKVKIGLLRSQNVLEKESEIIKFIVHCYKPKNGVYVVHLGKLYNDMRHHAIKGDGDEVIDITTEYTVYQIQQHLKRLENARKVTLHFDDECFVLKVQREIQDHEELVTLCHEVFEYVSKHEKTELEKIDTLAQALKIIANNQHSQSTKEEEEEEEIKEMDLDEDADGGDAVNQKSITLHDLVDHYFKCKKHDEFLDFVQSYLPSYDHIRNQPVSKTNVMYEEVRESLEIFMKENPSMKRVRSIAKIFHGFGSPLFPIQVWGKHRFWNKYGKFPFMQIMEIAKEIKMEKKERMKEAKKHGNRLIDANQDGNDTDSSVSEFSE